MCIAGTVGIDKDAIELGIFPINQMDYTDYYPPSFFDNYTSKEGPFKLAANGTMICTKWSYSLLFSELFSTRYNQSSFDNSIPSLMMSVSGKINVALEMF